MVLKTTIIFIALEAETLKCASPPHLKSIIVFPHLTTFSETYILPMVESSKSVS